MKSHRTSLAALAVGATLALAAGAASAQEPVRSARHVLGLASATAEARLAASGYERVRAEPVGDSVLTYYREARSGRCVAARATNDHYASIVYAPDADCATAPKPLEPGPTSMEPGEEEFDTVCGVESEGRVERHRCHLRNRGCSPGTGKQCTTTVTMPGDEYRIAWRKEGIEVTFQGQGPRRSTVSTDAGQTRFRLDDQVYFVYRLKREADRELARLQP